MITWKTVYEYLTFQISFEDTGIEELEKSWDPLSGPLIPEHEPVPPGILINGLDKILAGEISFPVFKQWSRVACFSLAAHVGEETKCIENIFYQWEEFSNYASKQNASKKRMIEEIHALKYNIVNNRFYCRAGLKETEKRIDKFEKHKRHTDEETKQYLSDLYELADHGDFEALNYIGTMYYSGRILEQDYFKAKELYEKASKEGSTQALINLGYIYYYARCGGEPDYKKAYECFLRASKIGSYDEMTEAMYKLSDMYENGYFVKRQRTKAFKIVEELYDKEFDRYEDDGYSQFLGDLTVRLAKAYSKEGIHTNLQKSLHYYCQALYLIEDRWDGKWFGDKQLIETCNKNIAELRDEVFGANYDGKSLSILHLMGIVDGYKWGYNFNDLVYDPERKEIYLYINGWGLRTFENINFTDSNVKLCVVIPVSSAKVNNTNLSKHRFGSGNVEIWPKEISEKSNKHKWEISLSFFDDVECRLVEFTSKNDCGAYIGYIRDCDFNVVYRDERYTDSPLIDSRYIMSFWIDYGGTCLWTRNDKAIEEYGSTVNVKELPISEELKKNINEMCEKFDEISLTSWDGDGEAWSDQERNSFIENVERPIYERLVKELGDEYLITFDE